MSTPSVYALLVGVDRYDNPQQAPNLRGCVADTQAMHSFLTTRLQVPEERILWLTSTMEQSEAADRRATRANVIKGWQQHLTQAGPGDHVFFHYSGHGAQAKTIDPENEPDGLDETIVPADSRTPGIFDILDKELAALIATVEAKGARVTCFMDCCHSGSGTRMVIDPSADRPRTRMAAGDNRDRPLETVVTLPAGTRAVTGPKGPSGILPLSEHILLAGCRDEELSHEYRSPETGQWQGATTYFLLKKLASYQPGLTWAEVHDYVQSNVHAVYARQSPQLEGPGELQVFGGIGESVAPYVRVQEIDPVDPLRIKLGAGVAIGLTEGSRVAIYGPGSDLRGAPLVNGMVTEVRVDHSWVAIDMDAAVELSSRVVITSYGVGGTVYRVATDDQTLALAISTAYAGQPSPFFDVVPAAEAGADMRVAVVNGRYAIQDGTGVQIVLDMPATTAEGAAKAVSHLEHLARFRSAKSLNNPDPYASLTDQITISAITGDRLSGERMIDQRPLRANGGEYILNENEPIQILVESKAPTDLYVAVFVLDSETFAIQRVYPHPRRGPNQKVVPGSPPIKAYSASTVAITNPALSTVQLTFKVFATKDPTEFDALQLAALNQPVQRGRTRAAGTSSLARLINAGQHDGTRVTFGAADSTGDDWTTSQVEIKLISSSNEVPLPAGQESVEVGTNLGIVVKKPSGFVGRLIANALSSISSRSTDGGMTLPSFGDSTLLEPVGGGAPGTRAAGSSPTILDLEAEGDQFSLIDAQNPLHVELDIYEDPHVIGILPIAYDGQFFHIVGEPTAVTEKVGSRAVGATDKRTVAVDITFLPEPELGEDEIGARDLKRTVRLFFYKMIQGALPADTGLRKAHLDATGQPAYAPVTRDDIAQASKIALMVHGFTADTGWLVNYAWPKVQSLAGYDLCLTFDYETFNTPIKENGSKLALALEAVGIGPDDGVQLDIFAHSMGTQVSRSLVEIFGGHRYVDRVFMGGALNAGSVLVKAGKLLPWLSTVMLNGGAVSVPPALLIAWATKKVTDLAVAIQDMNPDSAFFQEINSLSEPNDVPYYVQIGDNTANVRSVNWNRLFEKSNLMAGVDAGLDLIFGGQNDLAVAVSSAQNLRHGQYPNLTVHVTKGNHFQYFNNFESETVLAEWLREG